MPYKIKLSEIDNSKFESLVVLLCSDFLGSSVTPFAMGRDGGRDGYFNGTANNFPSKNNSYSGKFIIQAKHTNDPTASCGDSDFLILIRKEIPKIKKKLQDNDVDYYLLFTNRKLPAEQELKLRKEIIDETRIIDKIMIQGKEKEIIKSLKGCHILGVEYINNQLVLNRNVVKACELDKFEPPFIFNPSDFRELICKFYDSRGDLAPDKTFNSNDFVHPGINKKNIINNLSADYYDIIKQNSASYFSDIEAFLSNPINEEYTNQYWNVADELNCKIFSIRDKFDNFDKTFTFIYDYICEKHPELQNKREND